MAFSTSLRNRAVSLVVDTAFNSAAALARLRPDARFGDRIEVHRNVPYGDRKVHRLDVYRPRHRSGKLPIALYVHGGGFRILSKDTHWMMAKQLVDAGFLVFNINYRLADEHPFPAGLHDAAQALEWVVDHAEAWNGDLSQLLLAGESAGGNLVSALTVACCFEREEAFAQRLFKRAINIRAVAPLCGFLQVSNPERYDDDPRVDALRRNRMRLIVDQYLRGESDPTKLELADPLCVFESDRQPERSLPPFFASVGAKDPIFTDTKRLEKAMIKRSLTHSVRYYTGQMHAFQALYWTPQGRRSWEDLFVFLRSLGFDLHHQA